MSHAHGDWDSNFNMLINVWNSHALRGKRYNMW